MLQNEKLFSNVPSFGFSEQAAKNSGPMTRRIDMHRADDLSEEIASDVTFVENLKATANVSNPAKATDIISINLDNLKNFFRSKKALYKILTVEGQLYLPKREDCSLEFM
jgi:hypothetical protein